ncbi:MAG: hypothetical protein M3Q23_13910 [Actinomycetota bacterium]|nr:hypothetical protein [Actinomycetota bacterium]
MNDLENRLRGELRRQAEPDPFRPMPEGTVRRIRGRQGRTVVAAAIALSLIVGGAFTLARVVPGNGKAQPAASETRSPAPSPSPSPSPAPPAPSPSFGPWPVVAIGGDFTPYDGAGTGERQRRVVAYGTVDGVPWSVTVGLEEYTTNRCVGLFLKMDGGTFCSEKGPQTLPGMSVLSTASNLGIGYVGVLAPAVKDVTVHLDDGEVRPVAILPGPPGDDLNYFVLFPPPRAPGVVVANDARGNVLGRAPLCAWDRDRSPGTSISGPCLNG